MIFISVLIPTYNRASLIARTIDSILKQTFDNYEIIVIDNCSSDNTVEILNTYVAKNQIKLFIQPENYERSVSRNLGISVARGEFITLIDSDDIFYPCAFEDAYNYNKLNKNIKFFHCNHEFIKINGEVIRKNKIDKEINVFKKLSKSNYISNIGIFIKRELALSIKYDEEKILIGSEDYDFFLRLLKVCKTIGYIDKINCAILQHDERTINSIEFIKIEAAIHYLINKHINENTFVHEYKDYKDDFIYSLNLYLCGAAGVRRNIRLSTKYLIIAIKSKPEEIFSVKFIIHIFLLIKYTIINF